MCRQIFLVFQHCVSIALICIAKFWRNYTLFSLVFKRPYFLLWISNNLANRRANPTDNSRSGLEEELNRFLNSDRLVSNADVFAYWKGMKENFPRGYSVAASYLVIPATSVSSERIFSLCGSIVTADRTRLTEARVNQLVFLNAYCRSRTELEQQTE